MNNSRMSSRKTKRKKSNVILNVLIGIVLLLIIVVVWNIVNDDENNSGSQLETTKPETEKEDLELVEEDKLTTEEIEEETETDSSSEAQEDAEETPETALTEELITTEESTDPNVLSVEIDNNWQPIGTSQSGEHVSSYDRNSIDWKEKEQALAYATKLDPSNMIINFLGNGGSPQKSVGTVTSKDQKEIYRVYLEWIEGQGWKPMKKEILKSLP